MNSVKCTKCGFTGWANAGNCKKCHAPLEKSSPRDGNFRPAPQQVAPAPSGFQILKNDSLSFIALILPVVAWGIYIAVTFFGVSFTNRRSGTVVENSSGDLVFLIAPILLTLAGGAFLFWRVSSIKKIFAAGERVVGRITDVSFFKDRGRIEFSYSYGRQNFQSASSIMKNSKTESYRSGDEVVLIVNSGNPKRALIQDLYV